MIDEPIDTGDVVKLPVTPRPPVGEFFLVPAPHNACIHFNVSFELDLDGHKCKCLACGAEVSPWFVLENLMNLESRWMRTRAGYQDEMKRLAERTSTKCRHCGKMTRISNR